MQPDEPLIPALATPTFAQPSAQQDTVFSGPLGLRAGWGIALFFLLTVLLGSALFFGAIKASGRGAEFQRETQQAQAAAERAEAAHQPAPPRTMRLGETLAQELLLTGTVLLAALGVRLLEKRRFGVYGLGMRHLRDLLPGAVVGLVSISVLVGLLRALHLLVFDGRLLFGGAAVRFGLEWLCAFLLVGLFEEFLFRGYLQFTLMRGLLGAGARLSPRHVRAAAFWMAAVIWSLLFSATHLSNSGEDWMGLVMVFLAGMVFSYALWRTGSLWWGIGFHLTWDWGQSFLFGVPDSGTLSVGRLFATHAQGKLLLSGSSDGPEGSLFVIPVLLLVVLVIRLHPQREQPPVEQESTALVPHPATTIAIP